MCINLFNYKFNEILKQSVYFWWKFSAWIERYALRIQYIMDFKHLVWKKEHKYFKKYWLYTEMTFMI